MSSSAPTISWTWGPEGGDRGGTIVAQGTPEEVAEVEGSYTGHFVKRMLEADRQLAAAS